MDAVVVPEADSTAVADRLQLSPDQTLRTGSRELQELFGSLTSLELDLLTVASAIYAYDLAKKRGEREEITRLMNLEVPVVNYHAFASNREQLEGILHVLSDDNWNLRFTRSTGVQERNKRWPKARGRTLLFSGGLDSLAGAVDLLDEHGNGQLQLASHITANSTTISAQRRLHEYLVGVYGQVARVEVRTGWMPLKEQDEKDAVEVSQRTRSFQFLAIAILAARRRGQREVVLIAENGQMAVHVPLNAARIGAFSTHTAHPEFVARSAQFFSELLGTEFKISNPYVTKTKAEVVAPLVASHRPAIGRSNSCWRSSRTHGHCGACVPCYVRRIALEFHNVAIDPWKRDIFSEDVASLPHTDDGKRNLSDLAEFALNFRVMSEAEIDLAYPEVYNDYFPRAEIVGMYRRFAAEFLAVGGRYPTLSHLLY